MDFATGRRILREARGKIALVASVGNDARNMVGAVRSSGLAPGELNEALATIETMMNAAELAVSQLDALT